MKILYIIESNNKIKVVYDCYEKYLEKSGEVFLNELCLKELCTKSGRIEAVKKVFGYKYNVPIFVNQDNIFLKVKANKVAWINIISVGKIYKDNDKVNIIFFSGKVLKVNTGYKNFCKKFKMLDILFDYVKKNK